MPAYTPYYGNYMPAYYQPMQNQYQPMMNQPSVAQNQQTAPQPAQQINGGIIWVQGEEGAKAYMVAPGNSVLLMDSENSSFYIKSSDASGMPMPLRVFDYTERVASRAPAQAAVTPVEEYVTRQEFDALAARLDALTTAKAAGRKPAPKEEADNG